MCYRIGDEVYLITDQEQKVRLITGILQRKTGIVYYLSQGTDETNHYDFEISKEKTHRFI